MKHYSKETYEFDQALKTMLFVLIVFLIGFLTGYICMNSAIEERQEINIIESER